MLFGDITAGLVLQVLNDKLQERRKPMDSIVKILSIIPVTHDVKSFRIEKPVGFRFVPGQATDVSINKPGMEEEKRPFTFTCLNEDPYLEFTIKRYSDHHGSPIRSTNWWWAIP